jgi:hypothetical protein
MPRLNGIAHITKPFRNKKRGKCGRCLQKS